MPDGLRLREYPVTQGSPPVLSVPMAVLSTGATPPADSWLERAHAVFVADPRVASVSAAAPAMHSIAGVGRSFLEDPGRSEGTAFASEPVGDHIIVNLALRDLVPLPVDAEEAGSLSDWQGWARRANHRGLRHVWLLDGRASLSEGPAGIQGWPISPADAREFVDPLSGLSALRDRWVAGNLQLRVSVDASWLRDDETGAQVATVCWLQALADHPDVERIRLISLPGGRLPGYAAGLVSPKIQITGHDPDQVDDIYWRPYQPDAGTMLSRDRTLGSRLVTTVLDLIEFSNERYHGGAQHWTQRRGQMRRYLRQTDLITGISQDVLDTVSREVPGVEAERLHRTALGVDHLVWDDDAPQPRWLLERCPHLGGRRFLLVLGNDFVHKNRDFAIRVWREVSRSVEVDLVMAGLHVSSSSTGDIEDQLLAGAGAGPGRVDRLRHVPGDVKSWLLANAAVVLYPTSAEGFGFIPHEAARLGTPSVFTAFGPLGELCPDPSGVESWDVSEYARRIRELVTDPAVREGAVRRAREADRELTWAASTQALVAAFRTALRLPPQPYGLWERTDAPFASPTRGDDPNEPVDLHHRPARSAPLGGMAPGGKAGEAPTRAMGGAETSVEPSRHGSARDTLEFRTRMTDRRIAWAHCGTSTSSSPSGPAVEWPLPCPAETRIGCRRSRVLEPWSITTGSPCRSCTTASWYMRGATTAIGPPRSSPA